MTRTIGNSQSPVQGSLDGRAPGERDGWAKVDRGPVGTFAETTSNLMIAPWPTVEHYGADHGKWTAQLAEHIASMVLSLSARDADIVRLAGFYHDLGRSLPFGNDDPNHAQRSAELAERVLRGDPQWWSRGDLIGEVCKLIAGHRLPPLGRPQAVPRPTDHRAIALWDADCYEAARIAPKTETGMQIVRERYAQVITKWAMMPNNKMAWRKTRGW